MLPTPSASEIAPAAAVAATDILNSLADGVYVTDRERRIVFWNAAAERITGWTQQDVLNVTCFSNLLMHVDQDGNPLCGRERCPLHRSIVTGEPSSGPMLVFARRKDGTRVPTEVTVSPVRDHTGAVVGGVEVFRDLTAHERDLMRAKAVQETVLRCALPTDLRAEWRSLYQPADVVGGDFFRCEQIVAGLHGALLADAVGHGVAAALHTMLLRLLWDEHRADLSSPARLLRALNRGVHPFVRGEGYFGTAVAVVYDAENGELRCARAGHPAPLLFRAGGALDDVGEPGFALGLLPDAEYTEATTILEPGETLLLHSDGAEEVPGLNGEELGRKGFAVLARQLLDTRDGGIDLPLLAEQLVRRATSVRLPDDLTLLSLRRTA